MPEHTGRAARTGSRFGPDARATRTRVPRRLRALTVGCASLLLLSGCSGAESTARQATSEGRPPPGHAAEHPDSGDFNGDGYDDLVDVIRSESKDKKRSTTTVTVIYGSRSGLDPKKAVRTPAAAGLAATSLLRTDLDGDGFTDLVWGGLAVAGGGGSTAKETFAMFGGARGLSGVRRLGLPDGFSPLAAADFDGDGAVDLLDGGSGGSADPSDGAAASPGRLLYGPIRRTGGARREVRLDVDQHGYAAPATATTGDFDHDGRAEVVFTYRYDAEEDETAPTDLSPVSAYEGSAHGLVPRHRIESRLVRALSGERGPSTPTAGDADGDGVDDLLLPTTGSASGRSAGGGGAVAIWYGAASGLGSGRPATVLGGGDRAADFGATPSVGDVNGDRRPDVVVDSPGFGRHDGRVTLLPGGTAGVPGDDGRQSVDVSTEGLPGTPNPHGWNAFEHRPPLLDVDGDGYDDVIVFGALYNHRHGQYTVLRGAPSGLDPRRTRHFSPEDAGVPPRLE